MPTLDAIRDMIHKFGLLYTLKVVVAMAASYAIGLFVHRYVDTLWPHRLRFGKVKRAHKRLSTLLDDLSKHNFFTSHLNALHLIIPHIGIEDPMRRALFQDLLEIYTRVFYDSFLDFVKNRKLDEISQEYLQQIVCNLYTSALSEFEMQCFKQGIPSVVVEKFAVWHSDIRATTLTFLTQATSSNFYQSNTMRMVAVLDWFTAALQVTLFNAEKTLGELNGELDSVVYKGIKAVSCHCPE